MSRYFPRFSLIVLGALSLTVALSARSSSADFHWPEGKRSALSLSFDDARLSQPDSGVALLDKHGVKATFFVNPSGVEKRLAGWRRIVAAGHEIGNHSLNHPCSGNFQWARNKALEDYTLEKMRYEFTETNRRIKELLGVTADTFAYPCGQTFVGRGLDTRSYVPLVAGMFIAGRGFNNESPNDPSFCDMAQLTGVDMDGRDFEQILPLLQQATIDGAWLVLAGHEIGPSGTQTTRTAMLEKLIQYAQDQANGVWLAPVGTVARHILSERERNK